MTGLNVRIAFLRVEATAGTSAHITSGGNGSQIARANGFFTVPHFSILQDDWTHVYLLAVRLGGAVEKVGKTEDSVALGIDMQFLEELGISREDSVGLVVEVKSGDEEAIVDDIKFDYVKPFFGTISKLNKVGFEGKGTVIKKMNDQVIVPLRHCLDFIYRRFQELDQIDLEMRGSGRLTKEGSWYLSEEFLSDLLFLKKSGISQTDSHL